MALQYELKYERVISGEKLNKNIPRFNRRTEGKYLEFH
jgi:hypothetical protein